MRPRIGWRDHTLGFVLGLAYVVLLFATAGDLAMSRDEGFYVRAGEEYARWFSDFAADPGAASSPESIEAGWSYNHEHPALIKSLFALSWLAHESYDLYPTDSLAFRFPAMVMGGLLLWLLYIFGARVFGRRAGIFAALSFALIPRVFYHAHLDAFDVPIVLMVTLAVYAYWRALRSRWWVIGFGLIYGLALATKHNAWILPGIFLIHFSWMSLGIRADRRRDRTVSAQISVRPWWMISMALLGPAIFIASWPWLWHETLPRIGWYIRFHTSHDYYNMEYFGRNYFRPPFPVSFPFVMTLFTVPLTTLALAGYGLMQRGRAMLPMRVGERLFPDSDVTPDTSRTDVLLVGCLLAPLVVIALPSSPIFGGTKHWITAYPFVCLYAGLGFYKVATIFRQRAGQKLPFTRQLAPTFAAALLLAPAAVETIHSHPFGLSHYTYAAGGVPGAADHGMNRQFWGFTTGSVLPFLKEAMPEGGSVYLNDTTPGAWAMLQRDGQIPANLRPAYDLARADYVLVHHEKHFAEVDHQAWVAFESTAPAHVLTYDGVPIVTIYENPRRR